MYVFIDCIYVCKHFIFENIPGIWVGFQYFSLLIIIILLRGDKIIIII